MPLPFVKVKVKPAAVRASFTPRVLHADGSPAGEALKANCEANKGKGMARGCRGVFKVHRGQPTITLCCESKAISEPIPVTSPQDAHAVIRAACKRGGACSAGTYAGFGKRCRKRRR